MKKIFRFFKKKITNYKQSFKSMQWYQRLIYVLSVLLISIFIYFVPWFITLLILIIAKLIILFVNNKFQKKCSGNGIIFGGRGKGKGILLNYKVSKQKKYFSNINMGGDYQELNIKEYFNVLGENTIENTIDNEIKIVDKTPYLKYENVNLFFDDTTVYVPNFLDTFLKKAYPSAPLVLAVNRHLFNHYMILTTQSRERPWKIIKELQTDFSIKALKTKGFGKIWDSIPILRNYVKVNYRYYEETNSAEQGLLPFKGKGLLNEATKTAYLTSGQATKETFNAQHGVIYESFIFINKKKLTYDTRVFHEKFFGFKV